VNTDTPEQTSVGRMHSELVAPGPAPTPQRDRASDSGYNEQGPRR